MFQKAGLVWAGLGEDGGAGETDQGAGGGSARVSHWMAVMAEHMAQESRSLPFLWPKLGSTGNLGKFPS